MHFELLRERVIPVLLVLIPALLNLYLVYFIFKKMSRNAITDLFIFFLISLLSWQFYDLIDRLTPDKDALMLFDRIFCHGWIASAPLGLHFAIKLNHKSANKIPIGVLMAIYLPALFFVALYPALTTPDNYKLLEHWGWFNVMKNSPFHTILLIWFVVNGMVTLYFFTSNFMSAEKGSPVYYQALLICIGYAIPAFQGIITQVVFPVVLHIDPVPITSTFMSIFSLLSLLALRQYPLFRLEDTISSLGLMKSLTDIGIALGKNYRIDFINDNGAATLGYTAKELIGKNIEELTVKTGPETPDIIDQIMRPALKGEHIQDNSFSLNRKDGSALPVSIVADRFSNAYITQGILIIARDISDLKKNLDEIQRQSALMQQLFDASPLAMVMVDLKGDVLRANPAFEKIFQYTEEEILGKRMGAFIIPEDLQEETRDYWEQSSRPRVLEYETKRKRKNGEVFDVHTHIFLISLNGQLFGVYSIYEDITERKNAENLLKKQNEELVKVNKELDKFVYSISHDIRAPLMSIKGILNLAGSEPVNAEDYVLYLHMIRQNINRLDDFTSSTIRYFKNAREEIQAGYIDFGFLINEVIETLRYQPGAADIEFKTAVEESNPFVSDMDKLRIILNNLISNAIKYRKLSPAKPVISILVKIRDHTAEIIISDNGEGIPQDKLDKAFTMFSRFSERSTGSGLGLYIVKEMVEKLCGEITLNSVLGEGTAFTIIIPEYNPPQN
jgi:PAS domain S-box-containing protein